MPPSSTRNKTPKTRGHGHRKSSTHAPMKGGSVVASAASTSAFATGAAAYAGGAAVANTKFADVSMVTPPLWTYAIYVAMFVILGMIVYMLWLLLNRMERGHKNMDHGQDHDHAENTVNLFGPLASIPTRSDPFNDPYVPPLKVDTTYFPTRSFYDLRVGGDRVASGPNDSGDIRGLPVVAGIAGSRGYGQSAVPINVRTRGYEPEFSQLGVLVRDRGASEQDPDSRNGGAIGRAKYQATFGQGGSDPQDTTYVNPKADSSSLYDNQILPLMGRRVLNGRDKYQYYTLGGAGGNTKLPIQVGGRSAMDENGVNEIMNRDRTFVPGYGHAYRADVYQNALYRYLPSFL